MKCRFLLLLLVAATTVCALGATSAIYENDGSIIAPPVIPPQIDAYDFVNKGQFIINFTNNVIPELPPPQGVPPYETQNTRNYSNYFGHLMACNSGFRMEYYNSQAAQRQRASTFYNGGTINCGTIDTTNIIVDHFGYFGSTETFFLGVAGSEFTANASNIFNAGSINMGFESLFTMKGSLVDLSSSTIFSDQTGISISSGSSGGGLYLNQGIFDGYWSVNDVRDQFTPPVYPFGINPAAYFGGSPPITPVHVATNRYGTIIAQQLVLTNSLSYLVDQYPSTDISNRFVQAVFLSNTNANLGVNVYLYGIFGCPDIVIEYTNKFGTSSNNVYVTDFFGCLTNFYVVPHGFAGGRGTFIPFNYNGGLGLSSGVAAGVIESPPLNLGPPSPPTPIPFGTFNNSATTNQFSAYQALFQPLTQVLGDTFGLDVTNLPGRIEITADNYMKLSRARITGLNYLKLEATNQFGGSAGGQISSPAMDLYLRSTNGILTISNMILPIIEKPEGFCNLYSARWTNVSLGDFGFGFVSLTNSYHVLFDDIQLSPRSHPAIQTCVLRCTNALGGADNLLIGDALNVTRTLLLEASRITLITNGAGAQTPAGSINITSPNIIWPNSTPRLRYLTNYGSILALNAVFFGGARSSPYYSSNYNEPYVEFINTGGVTNFSSQIWASDFQNSGTFYASGGDIQLQQCQTALLTNGLLLAPNGAISLGAGSLTMSNTVFQAGSSISLSVTNVLDDGSLYYIVDAVTNKSVLTASNGVNLLNFPTNGASLLATTITNTDITQAEIQNSWAGQDYGCLTNGFYNNAAVGRLILDGLDPQSLFTFNPIGPSNALYVDRLEFHNSIATNRDASGNWVGVNLAPGMKIYYGQALANGVSISRKLNGTSGGAFCWVTNYAGFFSGTNFVYPDGTTNRLNTDLVTDCVLDSDGDGIVNCNDPTPVFIAPAMQLRVAYTNRPVPAALVSWFSPPLASNFLYYVTGPGKTNWQMVTNFLSGSVGGRVMVTDTIKTNGVRFYKARVAPR